MSDPACRDLWGIFEGISDEVPACAKFAKLDAFLPVGQAVAAKKLIIKASPFRHRRGIPFG
jgi:hypothetical protein